MSASRQQTNVLRARIRESAGIDDSDKGNFPPLAVDLFVTKLDRAGEELWTRRFSPSGYQNAEGWGIAVDPADNVLLTGNFGGTMDLDPNFRRANR